MLSETERKRKRDMRLLVIIESLAYLVPMIGGLVFQNIAFMKYYWGLMMPGFSGVALAYILKGIFCRKLYVCSKMGFAYLFFAFNLCVAYWLPIPARRHVLVVFVFFVIVGFGTGIGEPRQKDTNQNG